MNVTYRGGPVFDGETLRHGLAVTVEDDGVDLARPGSERAGQHRGSERRDPLPRFRRPPGQRRRRHQLQRRSHGRHAPPHRRGASQSRHDAPVADADLERAFSHHRRNRRCDRGHCSTFARNRGAAPRRPAYRTTRRPRPRGPARHDRGRSGGTGSRRPRPARPDADRGARARDARPNRAPEGGGGDGLARPHRCDVRSLQGGHRRGRRRRDPPVQRHEPDDGACARPRRRSPGGRPGQRRSDRRRLPCPSRRPADRAVPPRPGPTASFSLQTQWRQQPPASTASPSPVAA